MKAKGLISLVLSAALILSLTACSDQTVSSSDAPSSSADFSMGFDPADRVVSADSDIFSGGKMLGGTVVDYLWKTVWGGQTQWDCLGQLRDNGMNWVRVGVLMKSDEQLANTPFEEWGSLKVDGYGWSTLEYAKAILRDAQEKGLRKNLFFFLSDQDASGAKQPAPAEWQGLTVEETCAKLTKYCYETAKYFQDKGLSIDLYDLGNEIERGIVGFFLGDRLTIPSGVDIQTNIQWMRDNVWDIEAQLLIACIEGVKKADPDAKFNLHSSCYGIGANNQLLKGFYKAMVDFGVPYDVAGVSYYWNGIHTYENGMQPVTTPQEAYFKTAECKEFTDYIVHDLGKKFIFSEFVYPNASYFGLSGAMDIGYPFTIEGQADWVEDFLEYVMNTPEISGCIYFYPEYYPIMHSQEFDSLNYSGLFTNTLIPNAALKKYNQYK